MLIKYALSQTSILETIIYTAVFWFILMWTNDAHLLNGTSLQQFFGLSLCGQMMHTF